MASLPISLELSMEAWALAWALGGVGVPRGMLMMSDALHNKGADTWLSWGPCWAGPGALSCWTLKEAWRSEEGPQQCRVMGLGAGERVLGQWLLGAVCKYFYISAIHTAASWRKWAGGDARSLVGPRGAVRSLCTRGDFQLL